MATTLRQSLILYALIAAALAVLTLIPVLGVIFIFLGAPFWISLLLHFAMGRVVVEAIMGQVSRSWLLLPCAAYGVLFSAILLSRLETYRLDNEIKESNSAIGNHVRLSVPLAFNDGGVAGGVVSLFDVAQVFNLQLNPPMSVAAESGGICDVSRNSASTHVSFPQALRTRGLCQVSRSSDVPDVALIETRRNNVQGAWNSATLIEMELPDRIVAADADSRVVKLGYTSFYSYFPRLVFGCGLNPGEKASECSMGLARSSRWVGLPDIDSAAADDAIWDSDREALVLGHALGLSPRFQEP